MIDYVKNPGKFKYERMRWFDDCKLKSKHSIKLSALLDELKIKLDKGAPTNILVPKLAHTGKMIHGIK